MFKEIASVKEFDTPAGIMRVNVRAGHETDVHKLVLFISINYKGERACQTEEVSVQELIDLVLERKQKEE